MQTLTPAMQRLIDRVVIDETYRPTQTDWEECNRELEKHDKPLTPEEEATRYLCYLEDQLRALKAQVDRLQTAIQGAELF
jgi:hypothetical protein